jgi:hypothetical protein
MGLPDFSGGSQATATIWTMCSGPKVAGLPERGASSRIRSISSSKRWSSAWSASAARKRSAPSSQRSRQSRTQTRVTARGEALMIRPGLAPPAGRYLLAPLGTAQRRQGGLSGAYQHRRQPLALQRDRALGHLGDAQRLAPGGDGLRRDAPVAGHRLGRLAFHRQGEAGEQHQRAGAAPGQRLPYRPRDRRLRQADEAHFAPAGAGDHVAAGEGRRGVTAQQFR